jgi:hypothetical protein
VLKWDAVDICHQAAFPRRMRRQINRYFDRFIGDLRGLIDLAIYGLYVVVVHEGVAQLSVRLRN